jgi:hypothetical protein
LGFIKKQPNLPVWRELRDELAAKGGKKSGGKAKGAEGKADGEAHGSGELVGFVCLPELTLESPPDEFVGSVILH